MRAVRCREGRVEVQDVPPPKGEGVRVRVRSAGICGSDLHLIRSPMAPAATLGHEVAGLTDDGTAVAIEPLRPCGHCEPCVAGDYNRCPLGPRMVMGAALDGGMADEMRVPERCLVPIAPGIRPEDACLVEPLAVAVHGFLQVGLRGGQRAAIVGGGSIGLCAAAAAVGGGARVDVVARHPHQQEAARRLGAGALDEGAQADGAYELVVDAAGTPAALEQAVRLARPGATLLLLASYWEGLVLPGFVLCMKEVRVVPSMMYGRQALGRDVDVAAALLARRPEIARTLITHRFPLDAAPEAFALAADRSRGAIKVVLEP